MGVQTFLQKSSLFLSFFFHLKAAEIFSSFPDQVIVIKITASKPILYNFTR